MTLPKWSMSELAHLQRMFLELRGNASSEQRRDLAFRLILLPASMDRLRMACNGACTFPADLINWREDVLNDAQLCLADWLSADNLNYADLGIAEFGTWYWTLCCRACGRSTSSYRHKGSQSLAYVDPAYLMECPVTPHIDEHPFDRLSRAIARLPEGRQRNIILDLEAGLTVDESARHRGIPPRTVDWLRHRGRELLLELCAGDAIDGD